MIDPQVTDHRHLCLYVRFGKRETSKYDQAPAGLTGHEVSADGKIFVTQAEEGDSCPFVASARRKEMLHAQTSHVTLTSRVVPEIPERFRRHLATAGRTIWNRTLRGETPTR
jgi:hypothetical protein